MSLPAATPILPAAADPGIRYVTALRLFELLRPAAARQRRGVWEWV